jgi:hypothetical protein
MSGLIFSGYQGLFYRDLDEKLSTDLHHQI